MGTALAVKPSETTIRVALVDDHRLVLDGLSARLGASGFSIVAAEPTWAGLLAHSGFPFDVVVLDLHLEDNIAIGTKMRVLRSAGVSVVVISRHSDSASVNAAMRAGAMGFVPKSDSADELIEAIRSAAVSQRYLSDEVASTLASFDATPDAGLGSQEHRALVFYAGGRSIKEVASAMNTTEETVKSYIKRGRRKYRHVGIDLGTRVLLRRHGIREGWIAPE